MSGNPQPFEPQERQRKGGRSSSNSIILCCQTTCLETWKLVTYFCQLFTHAHVDWWSDQIIEAQRRCTTHLDYVGDVTSCPDPLKDFPREITHMIEDQAANDSIFGGVLTRRLGFHRKPNPLHVLLELPVVDEGFFPFRNQLGFKLLREFHHGAPSLNRFWLSC